ncbi:Ig-like domain-containing protein [uncultured Shewanella sp.]|uniref:Ig-like domain-containing protein n=1 Tax=uncultured Shewanella sp. TaxID=173975 RepID=UPI00262249F6|nr:Ig-like domain-containing protein [uncultured Shewanella sp.]
MSIYITPQSAIVKSVSGLLKVKDHQGETLSLHETDYINEGEMILFNQDSIFSLTLNNGSEICHRQIKSQPMAYSSTPLTELVINDITTNNIINIIEASRDIKVSGYVKGDIEPNGEIQIDLKNNQYCTHLDLSGHFSIDIPGFILAEHDHITVRYRIKDEKHNIFCTSKVKQYNVMLVGPYIDLTLCPIHVHKQPPSEVANNKVTVKGLAKYQFSENDKVTITINHHQYITRIDTHGYFSLDIDYQDVLAAQQITATLTSYDISGNQSSISTSQPIQYTKDKLSS